MKETELALKFIEYFSDLEVYKEVPCSGIVDIITVNGIIKTAIEVKCSLNFDVIWQAKKNIPYVHYSYIAVPYPKYKTFAFDICKDYGIGVLTYQEFRPGMEEIQEWVKPKLNRKPIGSLNLKEYMKDSIAGSQTDRITAFGNTVNQIHQFLIKNNGRATVKDVIGSIDHHYKKISSAKSCIVNMCRTGVIKKFRYESGYFIVIDNG